MISSVSVYASYRITSWLVARGLLDEPNNSYFMIKTVINVIVAIAAMIIFSKIPYELFEKYAKHIFAASLIGLCLVFVPGLESEQNGAKWWIDIPWLPSIQPVEYAKIGLIIMLAYFLKYRRSMMNDFKMGIGPFVFIASLPVFLLMFQPDFGSILILSPIILFMYFVGNGNIKILWIAFALALVGASAIYGIGKMQQNAYQARKEAWIISTSSGSTFSLGYITTRVDNFFRDNKEIAISRSTETRDHQLRNAFIALGSGGFFGLGFGNSIQKFWYLPEVEWDFIFSVIVEELGFIGWLAVIGLYLFIAYRGYMIARSVKDLFGKYLAFGITTWFVVQAFVNIGVNLNVVPLTGVTLPFISYGGSSVASLGIAAGILLSISRHVEVKPQNLSDALQSGRKVTF